MTLAEHPHLVGDRTPESARLENLPQGTQLVVDRAVRELAGAPLVLDGDELARANVAEEAVAEIGDQRVYVLAVVAVGDSPPAVRPEDHRPRRIVKSALARAMPTAPLPERRDRWDGMTIGGQLRAARKNEDMSQAELADAVGATRATVSYDSIRRREPLSAKKDIGMGGPCYARRVETIRHVRNSRKRDAVAEF